MNSLKTAISFLDDIFLVECFLEKKQEAYY